MTEGQIDMDEMLPRCTCGIVLCEQTLVEMGFCSSECERQEDD